MITATTRNAICSAKDALRVACSLAIQEGDLDEAGTLLCMLKGFEVSFGAMTALTSHELGLAHSGLKIDAVKAVRDRLPGISLKDAKDLVEKNMKSGA